MNKYWILSLKATTWQRQLFICVQLKKESHICVCVFGVESGCWLVLWLHAAPLLTTENPWAQRQKCVVLYHPPSTHPFSFRGSQERDEHCAYNTSLQVLLQCLCLSFTPASASRVSVQSQSCSQSKRCHEASNDIMNITRSWNHDEITKQKISFNLDLTLDIRTSDL